MEKPIKIALTMLVITGIVVIAFLVFSIRVMTSHGYGSGKFEQVQPGMTMQEVQNLLGKPSSTEQVDADLTIWRYAPDWTWCMAEVQFDSTGKVESKDHDH